MTTLTKIIAAREQFGISQAQMARLMKVSNGYLSQIESGKRTLTPKFIELFKEKLGVPMLPLNTTEDEAFKESLYKWKEVMSFQDADTANEMRDILKRTTALMPDGDLTYLFQLFEISYFNKIGDTAAAMQTLNTLEPHVEHFNAEVAYWYCRCYGNRAMQDSNYKAATKKFIQAEKPGATMNRNDDILYYNMGYCLLMMGFTTRALPFIDKAYELTKTNGHNRNNLLIRCLQADSRAHTGRFQEALDLFEKCLWEEKNKPDARTSIGLIYRDIARVYILMGDYAAALTHMHSSFQYITPDDNEYVRNLHLQANILIKDDKASEGLRCLDEATKLVKPDSLLEIKLLTTMHLCSLDDEAAMQYIENVSIPTLKAHGHYLTLLECYETISTHFSDKKRKKAYEYMHRAFRLCNRLRRGHMF